MVAGCPAESPLAPQARACFIGRSYVIVTQSSAAFVEATRGRADAVDAATGVGVTVGVRPGATGAQLTNPTVASTPIALLTVPSLREAGRMPASSFCRYWAALT